MLSDDGVIVLGVDPDALCASFYGQTREIAAGWFAVNIESLARSRSYGRDD